jgi:signal transduction histidine kinase
MISTHWCEVHTPSERELRMLDVLARQATDLIENAQTEKHRIQQARALAVIEERHRFAREVHDGLSQSIFSASVMIDSVMRMWRKKPEKALSILEQLHQLTNGVMSELRMLLLELRPELVVNSKLSDVLTRLAHTLQLRYGLAVSLDMGDVDQVELPTDVHFIFYRVAQESLNNIIKHGQATQARLRIRHHHDRLELSIVDNGKGFDIRRTTSGLGLTSMHERATSIGARLIVQSRVGTGTKVQLVWKPDETHPAPPLHDAAQQRQQPYTPSRQ